jgi:hypothetical protein
MGDGGTMMTVSGLQLPASFVRFFGEHRYTNWDLKGKADAYGNPLQADFMPHSTIERMEQKTAKLSQYFGPAHPPVAPCYQEPGFLFDITDFSKIACFGRTVGGAPFCFDFRENPDEPSVIFHDDLYARWRRIAPDFDSFIGLFERYEEGDEE